MPIRQFGRTTKCVRRPSVHTRERLCGEVSGAQHTQFVRILVCSALVHVSETQAYTFTLVSFTLGRVRVMQPNSPGKIALALVSVCMCLCVCVHALHTRRLSRFMVSANTCTHRLGTHRGTNQHRAQNSQHCMQMKHFESKTRQRRQNATPSSSSSSSVCSGVAWTDDVRIDGFITAQT